MTQAYPLHWPDGWPRTPQHRRQRSRFDTTFGIARDGVLVQLERLGATQVVISTNIETRRDGLPYGKSREPEDVGVAVYFMLDGRQQCIPCDKWDRAKDNLRAIERTIEALRGIERWGAKDMVQAAFRGFEALPPPSGESTPAEPPWYVVLGVSPGASRSEIQSAYRSQAKKCHPDNGGTAEAFNRLQRAYERAQAAQ